MAYESIALLSLPDPQPLMKMVEHELADHDLPFTKQRNGQITSPSEYGILRYTPEDGALRIEIAADTPDHLYILRESIEAHLTPVLPMLTAPVIWSGTQFTGTHPPHFRQVKVASSQQMSPNFIRLRFTGENLLRYATGGFHFRLVLPGNPLKPVWPTVSDTGSTIWPTGADSLHMPAYTFRHINAGEGWFDVDIFAHGNGKTCDWARDCVGQVAGILGPGGGELPGAGQILLIGDETALPAIARMVETAGQKIRALVAVKDPADMAICDFPEVERVAHEDLLARVEADLATRPFVWFAGQKADARALKALLKRLDYGRDEMQVQAYW